MKKAPNIYTLKGLMQAADGGTQAGINGQWVPARPVGFWSLRYRLRAAWLVWTGKADAVVWPLGQ